MYKKMIALLLCLCMLPVCSLAEEAWVVGVWTMLSGTDDGEPIDMAQTFGEGCTMMSVFGADGAMMAYSAKPGRLTWSAVGKLVTVSDGSKCTRQGNGMMKVVNGPMVGLFRRATDEEIALLPAGTGAPAAPTATPAPAKSGYDIGLNRNDRADGAEEKPAGRLALLPGVPEGVFSVSPDGGYMLLMEFATPKVYNVATQEKVNVSFDTARIASVADDHESLEALKSDSVSLNSKQIAWSPDGWYAMISDKSNATFMSGATDLYLLDAQTGLITMPAAWSHDPAKENFGAVWGGAFAPDGTLYFLVSEGGKQLGSSVHMTGAAFVLYTCNPATGKVDRVHELPVKETSGAVIAVAPNGDVIVGGNLVNAAGEVYDRGLVIGAQRSDMQQVAFPLCTPANVTIGANGMMAVHLTAIRRNSMVSTVALVDLNDIAAAQSGLVIPVAGGAAEAVTLSEDEKRWQEIYAGVDSGAYARISYAAISPDGTQLFMGNGSATYVMDVATGQATQLSMDGLSLFGTPQGVQWQGGVLLLDAFLSRYALEIQ